EHLRNGVKMEELSNLEAKYYKLVESSNNKPNIILNIVGKKIDRVYKLNQITDVQQYLLLDKLNTLVDIQGRCERIRNTPIPMAYAVLLKFFIIIYVIVLPLGLL